MKPEKETAVVFPQPQIAAASAPPPQEPTRPMPTVSHTGMGSGPGTARRASAPVTNPMTMIAITEPSMERSLSSLEAAAVPSAGRADRRGAQCSRRDELPPQILDLVPKLRRILEPKLLGRREHLLLQLDDQLL